MDKIISQGMIRNSLLQRNLERTQSVMIEVNLLSLLLFFRRLGWILNTRIMIFAS